MKITTDFISPETAVTLDGLFRERVRRSPDKLAYRYFDILQDRWLGYTWQQMAQQVARWQSALAKENLAAGERVALMLKNSPEWVMFDQAALAQGLVVVPLYTSDRAENAAYILRDAGVKILLLEGAEQWQLFADVRGQLDGLVRIVTLDKVSDTSEPRLSYLENWLSPITAATLATATPLPAAQEDSNALATIMYTSGTVGRPKGVMLSHRNILTNAYDGLQAVPVKPDDVLLSFLPLSHTFERTVGYYLSIVCNATVVYARSVTQLLEDFSSIRPTVIISVPRIYERVCAGIHEKLDAASPLRRWLFHFAVDTGYSRFEHQQGRGSWRISHLIWPLLKRLVADKVMAKLGGKLWLAMAGGAALSPEVSRVFIGLGLPVLQGYGLTESSPIVSVNRLDNNVPASVGTPLPNVEVKIGENDALLIRGPNVMLGYWNNPQATRATISPDGWLNSGDTARIDESGRIFITGRIKEIIVTSTGEKIPPVNVENAILRDPLFDQVMLVGEGRQFLSVIAVLNPDKWRAAAAQIGIVETVDNGLQSEQAEAYALEKIAQQTREFPGYAQVRRAVLSLEAWTVDNGKLTPTLKLKRREVLEYHKQDIAKLYDGH